MQFDKGPGMSLYLLNKASMRASVGEKRKNTILVQSSLPPAWRCGGNWWEYRPKDVATQTRDTNKEMHERLKTTGYYK